MGCKSEVREEMVEKPSNLAATLLSTAVRDHERIALVDFGGAVSYGELLITASGLANCLSRSGISPSTHVGIALEGIDFVEAYLGVLASGAVAVPLNPRSPAFELGSVLDATGTRVLLSGRRLGPQKGLDSATAKEAVLKDVEWIDYGSLREDALSFGHDANGKTGFSTADDYAALIDGFHKPAPDDPAALIMTGGTSGDPLAAVLTHRSMTANLRQLDSHPGTRAVPGDVALGVLPLFHIFGLNVVVGFSLYSGCTVAFPSRRDLSSQGHDAVVGAPGETPDRNRAQGPEMWAAAIEEFGVTVVSGSPNLYRAMLEAGLPSDTFSSVRVCTSGAAALSPELFDAFNSRFGQPLWEGYGMTEASPVITSSRLMPEPLKGCVGMALPGIELEVRDQYGNPVEDDDHGEIHIRGENVFAGYYGAPEQTSAALREGWLATGDVGVLDEEGRLYLVDRLKDVVIVGGFNVYPAEIEGLLDAHEWVAESAVTGEMRDGEERLVAFVVLSGSGPSAAEAESTLKNYLSSKLSRYKVPSEIRIVPAVPKTAMNKIRRRALG